MTSVSVWRPSASSALVAFAAAVIAVASALALTFPALTGRVVDDAGILDPATKAALEQKLADFETKTTGQLVVVTLKSLQGTSIEDYGYQLGRYWQIGQKDKNTGALLIIAPNERKVRIEVGYGFEDTLTDAVSRLIIENAIVPRLRVNDFAGGINRGVDDIIQAVSVDSEEWKARATTTRRRIRSVRYPRVSVLFVHFIHGREQRLPAGSRVRTNRRGVETELARANHCADTGALGILGFLVAGRLLRGGLGRRPIWWWRRLVRRRRRLG